MGDIIYIITNNDLMISWEYHGNIMVILMVLMGIQCGKLIDVD
jgi:hypothetical protein